MVFGEEPFCLSPSSRPASWAEQPARLNPCQDSQVSPMTSGVKVLFSDLCVLAPAPSEPPELLVASQPLLVLLRTIHLATSLSHPSNSYYCEIDKVRRELSVCLQFTSSRHRHHHCEMNPHVPTTQVKKLLSCFPPTFYHEKFQTCSKVKRFYRQTSPNSTINILL